MTQPEFQKQMARLIEQFGPNAYGTERCKLIWREVSDLSAVWWEKTVDELLGTCRYAPLTPEIREYRARERERIHEIEKAKYRKEAEEVMWSPEYAAKAKLICKEIMELISDE